MCIGLIKMDLKHCGVVDPSDPMTTGLLYILSIVEPLLEDTLIPLNRHLQNPKYNPHNV